MNDVAALFRQFPITTAILKIGSFIPQNVFALAEEALHGGTGRHRRVVTHKAKTRLGRELTPAEYENEILTVPDEDRPHIFWACPTVFDTISYVLSKLWGQNAPDKKAFLMGRIAQNMELTLIFQLVNMYIRFKI